MKRTSCAAIPMALGAAGSWFLAGCSCATSTGVHAVNLSDCVQPSIEPEEPRFMPGMQAAAIAVVLKDREHDSSLSEGERRLSNFEILVQESDRDYEIIVVPRSDGTGTLGGGNAYGKEVHYHVRKADMVLVRKHRVK